MDRRVVDISYRYLVEHEVDGSDRSNLIDSPEDEVFPIRERLGEAAMNAQIRDGTLRFDAQSEVPLPWFPDCLEVLSVHLSEYITGLDLAEGRNAEGIRVQVELRKYAGRRGDVIAVPLTHEIDFRRGAAAHQLIQAPSLQRGDASCVRPCARRCCHRRARSSRGRRRGPSPRRWSGWFRA